MLDNFDFQREFEAALSRLQGSGNYLPIPQVQPMQFRVPEYSPINTGAGVVNSYASPGPTNAGSGYGLRGLGTDLLYTLGGVGTILTDLIANWTDSNLDWKDIPLANWLANFGKGQMEAWRDDRLTLADVPILGGLIGAGKYGQTTSDILENLGWEEAEADPSKGWNLFERRKGNLDIGDIVEFVGDVLLDPLTLVTFGGASVAKSGATAAGKAAIKEVGEQAGKRIIQDATKRSLFGITTDVAKIADDVAETVLKNTGDEVAAQIARNNVLNAARTARATAQNALINIDIPFTNTTKQIGTKPSFFQISDVTIGEIGKAPIVRKLSELGLDEAAQKAFLKSAYGVDDAAQLTSQAAEHFFENIGKVKKAEDLLTVFKPVTDEVINYYKFTPDEILKNISDPTERNFARSMFEQLDQIPTTTPQILGNARTSLFGDLRLIRERMPQILTGRADELLDFASRAPGMVDEASILQSIDELLRASDEFAQAAHRADIAFAPFEKVQIPVPSMQRTLQNAQEVFNINRFAQDMGGTSPLGRWLNDRLSWLNPRSLGSADQFVDQAAGKIRDAENMMRSNRGWAARQLEQLQKLTAGLPEEDLAKIPYILEGKAPGGQTMEQFLSGVKDKERLMKAADFLRDLFAERASREVAAGALDPDRVLPNYFPHVINREGMTEEALEALLSDPDVAKYLGRSAKNPFAQSRKSFETFADWDDAIASLQNALKTETGPEKIAKINTTLETLQNLFVRDPIQATAHRIYKGVRAEAMSQLYGQLRQAGAIRLPDDIAKDGALALGKDFKRIGKDVADKLGLPVGTAIHEDVLKGLEKLPTLFTDEGIQRIVENLTSATNIWKNLVTTYVPSHHVTNLLGNIFNSTLAGVTPDSYKAAGRLLMKVRNGTLTEAERRFIQEALDHGIIGTGGQLLDVIDPLRFAQRGGTVQKIERAVANTRWARALRNVGDSIEDLSRLALYIHGKKTTGSAKKAADMVRKYLFNYGELTGADRVIKLVVPFWTWTKNNLPLQFMEFLSQPRYMLTLKKIQEALNVDDQQNPLLPEYIQRNYFRIPGTANTFFNPRIPAFELLNALDDPLGTAVNMISPVMKVPIELHMNKQIFSGAPIDPTKTDRNSYDPNALARYLTRQLGSGARLLNIFDPEADILSNLAGFLFGRPIQVDPAKEARIRSYQRREDLRAERDRRLRRR